VFLRGCRSLYTLRFIGKTEMFNMIRKYHVICKANDIPASVLIIQPCIYIIIYYIYIHIKTIMRTAPYLYCNKAQPRIGHERADGKWRYTSTLSLTSMLDGVKDQLHVLAFLLLQETRYPLCRSGRAPKISPLPRFDPRTSHPVVSRYNDYAIPTLSATKR